MTYYEEQKAEIATIKPRTFILYLSDADVVRVFEKAGTAGLTPSELLENFIGDLVFGTNTNGSDERMYANEWYDRCGFDDCSSGTFLRYILRWNCYNTVISCIDDMDEGEEEILHVNQSKDCEEDITYYGMIIEESRKELLKMFEEYCECNSEHETFKDAIAEVREYRENLERVLYGENDDRDNDNADND